MDQAYATAVILLVLVVVINSTVRNCSEETYKIVRTDRFRKIKEEQS